MKILENMPFADYLAADGISISRLKGYAKSPAHAALPKEETAAMKLGTAFHCAVLEPEKYIKTYAVAPTCDRRTKEGKSIFADFQIENAGKIILTAEDSETVANMAKAVREHSDIWETIQNSKRELSVFEDDYDEEGHITGYIRKARYDSYTPDSEGGLIIDLKKARDASPQAFMRACLNFGYDMQAAWYCDLDSMLTDFIFVAVEDKPPYGVGTYRMSKDFFNLGRKKYWKAVKKHRDCLRLGNFPGYSKEIAILEPPRWALTETEVEFETEDGKDDFDE